MHQKTLSKPHDMVCTCAGRSTAMYLMTWQFCLNVTVLRQAPGPASMPLECKTAAAVVGSCVNRLQVSVRSAIYCYMVAVICTYTANWRLFAKVLPALHEKAVRVSHHSLSIAAHASGLLTTCMPRWAFARKCPNPVAKVSNQCMTCSASFRGQAAPFEVSKFIAFLCDT